VQYSFARLHYGQLAVMQPGFFIVCVSTSLLCFNGTLLFRSKHRKWIATSVKWTFSACAAIVHFACWENPNPFEKTIKNPVPLLPKFHSLVVVVAKGTRPFLFQNGKGVNKVEFTSFQEHIEHQFDAFCKTALKFKACDIYKAIARLAMHEIEFSGLTESQFNSLSHEDEYFTTAHQFKVLDFDIAIQDELMAEALAALPEDRRRIVLLYYFLGMNDRKIGELLNLIRETVQYRRTSSLKQLKQFLEGKSYDEDE